MRLIVFTGILSSSSGLYSHQEQPSPQLQRQGQRLRLLQRASFPVGRITKGPSSKRMVISCGGKENEELLSRFPLRSKYLRCDPMKRPEKVVRLQPLNDASTRLLNESSIGLNLVCSMDLQTERVNDMKLFWSRNEQEQGKIKLTMK